MSQPPAEIQGAEKLTTLFGYWPSFHDAEVVRFSLIRESGEYPVSPTVECTIHVFEINCRDGLQGEAALTKHTLVTLHFREVVHLELYDFNTQNALQGLEITEISERPREQVKYAVEFEAANGMEAAFCEERMSWVANVLLMYSVGEEWIDDEEEEAVEYRGVSPCLTEVNRWLREQGWVELLDLTEHVGGRERHGFEAEIWGAALNHLDIEAFLACVKSQHWLEPENVQILIKDQNEEKFTLYTLPG